MIVLPVRKGGLGNQMFQVAAGLIYAKETGKELVIPNEEHNTHNVNNLDYANIIFSFCKQRLHIGLNGIEIDRLRECHDFYVYPTEVGFEPWSIMGTSKNIILHGYFQSYPMIEKYETLIRESFLQGITRSPSSYIGIHIRRGDFLKPPYSDVHFVLDESYYRQCIKIMKMIKPDAKYRLFSDDLDWCKSQKIFSNLDIEFVNEPNEILCLSLMSECEGGFICANSTFSWWGAFLGAYAKRSPCFVPSKWMKGIETIHLFPKEWIVI